MGLSAGIDLGTTYCVVAYVDPQTKQPKIIPNREGSKTTPSVLQFLDGRIIYGSEAESAFSAGEPNCVATFKRDMGKDEPYCTIDGIEYNAEDLSAILLKHLKEEAESQLGESITEAVITVPAYFYSLEREATIRAAKSAGLIVKKIIDEPNAAAMAYGLNHWRENANILVYDLGGGTFDVTLTRMGKNGELRTITTQGDYQLGGRDWDYRLEMILLEKFAEETGMDMMSDLSAHAIIRGLTEGAKRQLSVMTKTKVTTSIPDFGVATVEITRDEFEERTADLLNRTGSFCSTVLEEAGIKDRQVTDILLVGGSTKMPQVSQYIHKIFGKKPITHVNPDEAVALGAAIQSTKESESYVSLMVKIGGDGKKVTDRRDSMLNALVGVKSSKKLGDIGLIQLRETTAHAMGIIAISPDRTKYINDIIIPSNHPRPVRVAKEFLFYTSARGGNELEIFVLQGGKENPLDNQIPFRYVVSGLRHIREQKGETKVRVQYSYDNNGVIHVQARQESDTADLSIRRERVPGDMSMYARALDPEEFLKPEPLNVILAVDVSGSMSGKPLADAQEAMSNFIKEMDFSYTCVGILAVSDRTEQVIGLCADEMKCIQAIKSITCGQTGGGNSAHPYDEIKKILANEEGRRFAIILADGHWGSQEVAICVAKQCNQVGIETAAIGFGGADEQFLKAVSSAEANALMVEQSQLSSAFGSIAQSLEGRISKKGYKGNDVDTSTW